MTMNKGRNMLRGAGAIGIEFPSLACDSAFRPLKVLRLQLQDHVKCAKGHKSRDIYYFLNKMYHLHASSFFGLDCIDMGTLLFN